MKKSAEEVQISRLRISSPNGGMSEARIFVVAQDGTRTEGTMLLCCVCRSSKLRVFIPDGVDHVHFQCVECGVPFCNKCPQQVGTLSMN